MTEQALQTTPYLAVEIAPDLWNPDAAAAWSFLFSPVFGAILHMLNWRALGQPEKVKESWKWIALIVVYIPLNLTVSVWLPEASKLAPLTSAAYLFLLAAWYYAIGKSQQSYVLARFGTNYPRRSWRFPIGIVISILMLLILIPILLFFYLIFVVGVSV